MREGSRLGTPPEDPDADVAKETLSVLLADGDTAVLSFVDPMMLKLADGFVPVDRETVPLPVPDEPPVDNVDNDVALPYGAEEGSALLGRPVPPEIVEGFGGNVPVL